MVADPQEKLPWIYRRDNLYVRFLLFLNDGFFSALYVHNFLFSSPIGNGTLIVLNGIVVDPIICAGLSGNNAWT